MNAERNCIACNVERILIGVTPARNRHEMLTFECPKCRSIFRLVVPREPSKFAQGVSGHPC